MINNKISISPGNAKMGAIPSVSLPPYTTCPHDAPCYKKCYAAKLCRIYPSVKRAYENNYNILKNNDLEYWYQVQQAAKTAKFFRFHVSGDIPDAHYFNMMLATAEIIPTTQFLVFTKKYDIVNHAIDCGVYIPDNIKIIFSLWDDKPIPNPHNLPTAAVIFRGHEPKQNYKICGGNCAQCACAGVGCWELKNGETVAFYEH